MSTKNTRRKIIHHTSQSHISPSTSHANFNNNPSKVADLKLVLLGESAVGKSSLAQRFTSDTFDTNKESTIGAAFITKKIYIDDADELKLLNFQIWDTAGQERYKSLTPMYYRNSNIAIIVFDLTDTSSFKKAENWFNELKIFNSDEAKDLKIFLIGNKLDLLETETEVPDIGESQFIKDNAIKVIKTSAKTGEGIAQLFEEVVNSVDESMFVDVEDLESSGKALKRKNKSIIDLSSFQSADQSSCNC